MAKSRYFRVAGKFLNSQDLNKVLTQEALRQQEERMDAEVQVIVNELNDLLDDLSARTSNRGRGFYAVRYNDPFSDAPVKVTKRRNSSGDLSYTIRVENDKFNILDQGRPAIKSTTPMRFPRYSGKLTRPNSLNLNSPVEILDQRTVDDPNNLNQQVFGEGWVTVNEVREVKPRNFILNIAKRVRDRFNKRFGNRNERLVEVTVRKS